MPASGGRDGDHLAGRDAGGRAGQGAPGDLIADGNAARVAVRWEAAAAGGDLFAALDADLTLAPAGNRVTTLTLAGVYRLPPGTQGNGPGQAVVRRVAEATIQAFLDRAAAITVPGPASEWNGGTRGQGGSVPPAAQAPQPAAASAGLTRRRTGRAVLAGFGV